MANITQTDVMATIKVLIVKLEKQDDLYQRRSTALDIFDIYLSNLHLFDEISASKLTEVMYLKACSAAPKNGGGGDRRFEEYVQKFANVRKGYVEDEPTANEATAPMTTGSQTDVALMETIEKIRCKTKWCWSDAHFDRHKRKLCDIDEKKARRLKRELNLLL